MRDNRDILDKLRWLSNDMEYMEVPGEWLPPVTEAAEEIERLRADQREADEEFSLLQNDLGQALIEIENLRLALEVAANDLEDWGAYTKAKNARAALEGKND